MTINKMWVCKICKKEHISFDKPVVVRYSDGHICIFDEEKNEFLL
jgi:hypothetical protein